MRGVYIHIPFCVKKCRYCDFVSFENRKNIFDAYIACLLEEMKLYRGVEVDTVFIGGGTPSILNAEQLKRLILGCFENFIIADDYEFTIEANPGTLSDDKITALRECGVNRISVGVQSFNGDELSLIGRIHDAKTAYNTVCQLNELGFLNINIDIMTALPFQTMEKLKHTLETAVSLPVTHISAYSLILEEGTALKRDYDMGIITVPDDENDREMYHYAVEFLKEHGFDRYEISNFAKKGFECRHNIRYWKCGEYIGIGAAASSYFEGARFKNSDSVDDYLNKTQIKEEKEILTREDMISEFMILGLRMDEGISICDFEKRFKTDIFSVYAKELNKFESCGLLVREGERYRFSKRGTDVSNSVLCEFMLNC